MQLEGKVAIITGAGTGMGAVAAQLFAKEGAKVAISGRRAEKLAETKAKVEAIGGSIITVQGDISKPESVDDLVNQAVKAFGGIDILINNAGIHAKPYLTENTPLELFDEFMAINLRAPFMMTKAVIPHMLARGGGAAIVNIGSVAATAGLKYCVSYCTAKAGLAHMTRVVALDYANKGIRVNCLNPGGVASTENSMRMDAEDMLMMREAMPRNPLGRLAEAEEMAQTMLFMVGPHSGHITGSVFATDGGYTAA